MPPATAAMRPGRGPGGPGDRVDTAAAGRGGPGSGWAGEGAALARHRASSRRSSSSAWSAGSSSTRPAGRGSRHRSSTARSSGSRCPSSLDDVLGQRPAVPDRRGPDPRVRARARDPARPAGPVFFPLRLLATVYVDVFRAIPGLLIIFFLGFGVPALRIAGRAERRVLLGGRRADAASTRPTCPRSTGRASSRSTRARRRRRGRSACRAARRLRFVVCPRPSGGSSRRCSTTSSASRRTPCWWRRSASVEIFRESQILQAAHFNFTPYLATALVFLVVTIPLARFTDWLVARERRRIGSRRRPRRPARRRAER